MEKLGLELHLWGIEGIVLGEGEAGDEHSVLKVGPSWAGDGRLPLEEVVLCARSGSNTWKKYTSHEGCILA